MEINITCDMIELNDEERTFVRLALKVKKAFYLYAVLQVQV